MQKNGIDSSWRIFVAGHRGMVGSAVERLLRARGFRHIITADRTKLDLRDQSMVHDFIRDHRPDCVILAAAKVGGIKANMAQPADFLLENLLIQNNVIQASCEFTVKRFVFLGSSCIYPKACPQPMKEAHLLTGPLEPTNEGYALAKIAGLKLVQYLHAQTGFKSVSLMPCNLYGPNDSFDLEKSHVLSALVRRFVDAAKGGQVEVVLWGSGKARREFMHVDDLARAILHFAEDGEHLGILNVGWGIDVSIQELAARVADQAGYTGEVKWDTTKPEGMMRKCMDVTRMKELGFAPTIELEAGIKQMIDLYRSTQS